MKYISKKFWVHIEGTESQMVHIIDFYWRAFTNCDFSQLQSA